MNSPQGANSPRLESGLAKTLAHIEKPVRLTKSLRRLARSLIVLLSTALLGSVVWFSGAGEVIHSLDQLPPATLLSIAALVLGNLLLGSFRFWRILVHQGLKLPWQVGLRANLSGAVASLVVFSLFGQVLGRQATLQEYGVKSVTTAGLAAYERAVVTMVSASMAAWGLLYLYGQPLLTQILSGISLPQIALAVSLSAAASLLIGGSHYDRKLLAHMRSWHLYWRLAEIGAITVVNHLLMLGAFVLAIMIFAPDQKMPILIACAAAISFAASMPISVNGWGIREIAAIFVLGHVGVPANHALAASIAVGLVSTLVIFGTWPILHAHRWRRAGRSVGDSTSPAEPVHDLERISAWLLSMAAAVMVFFQMHVIFPGQSIATDINLADPFAILALAAVVLGSLATRRLPEWRAPGFNIGLLAIGTILLIAFIHGALRIGITQWALATRLFGWLVLLGYLAAGYLVVAYGGRHALRRFSQTLLVTGAVVILLTVTIRLAALYGWPLTVTDNFQGYAANRNAFAFQLVVCLAWSLAYAKLFQRGATLSIASFAMWQLLFALLLVGIGLSASRAGWLVTTVLLLVASAIGMARWRNIVGAVVLAAMLCLMFIGLGKIGTAQPASQVASPITGQASVASPITGQASDAEHLLSMEKGLEMWWRHPIAGAGLGVYIHKSPAWFGRPLVVHSTPIWILAEMGLIGICVFGAVFFILARTAYPQINSSGPPALRALFVLLLGFALFCQVHEIFYQRIFWLALGAALAIPASRAKG